MNLPPLQLTDLFASVAMDCLLAWSGQRECTPFHDALKASRLGQMPMHGVLPLPRIEAAAPISWRHHFFPKIDAL